MEGSVEKIRGVRGLSLTMYRLVAYQSSTNAADRNQAKGHFP